MKSFAPEIKVRNPFGKGGAAWLRSPARFASREEALAVAKDDALGWRAALAVGVHESADEINPDHPKASFYGNPEAEENEK